MSGVIIKNSNASSKHINGGLHSKTTYSIGRALETCLLVCLVTGLHKCLQVHRFWSFSNAFCVMKSLFLSALVCKNLKLKTSHCSWTRLVNAHYTNFHWICPANLMALCNILYPLDIFHLALVLVSFQGCQD